jgi:predicted SAM-dependent methyltransferase
MSTLRRAVKYAVRRTLPDSLLSAVRSRQAAASRQRTARRIRTAIETLLRGGRPVWLEFGEWRKRLPGWTTVDLSLASDITLDVADPLPFPPNTVDRIYSSHLLEHLSYPRPMADFLAECYRILKPAGRFRVAVPNARIWLEGYLKPEQFDAAKYCAYTPAFHYRTRIDFVNYIAYMDGHHHYMFDEDNLLATLAEAGFKDARLAVFDASIDVEAREFESIYAEATK